MNTDLIMMGMAKKEQESGGALTFHTDQLNRFNGKELRGDQIETLKKQGLIKWHRGRWLLLDEGYRKGYRYAIKLRKN